MQFHDRRHAGRMLAKSLSEYAGRNDVLVLGLPRGGVPVAYEVARELRAPLDVFLVRKLGVPGQEELAMGAIASGGVRVMNQDVVEQIMISQREIQEVIEHEERELKRRERLFRGDHPLPDLHAKVVILVDDGLATGSTMLAAVTAVKHLHPTRVVVAVPVAAESTCQEFRRRVDEIVCLDTPSPFYAVGVYYDDFSQTSDEEVWNLLQESRAESAAQTASPNTSP